MPSKRALRREVEALRAQRTTLIHQRDEAREERDAERRAKQVAARVAAEADTTRQPGPVPGSPLIEGGTTGRDVSLAARLARSEAARHWLDTQLGVAQRRVMDLELDAARRAAQPAPDREPGLEHAEVTG